MTKFNEILKGTTGKLKILPIVHTCDGYGFTAILKLEKIKLYMCDVFKKEYLYAYYGIPSYRNTSKNATNNLAFFPVCFIINYDKIPDLFKLHPFDTGAFSKIPEIKKNHFHPKMEITDFELNPYIIEAVKVVEKFYKSNKNYVANKPCVKTDDFAISDFEARSYTSLISDKTTTNYDNRVSTIEMIFNDEIKLNKEALIQVIIPNDFMDDQIIKDTLKDVFNISSPCTYYNIRGNPVESFGSIYNEYRKFTDSNNLL